MSTLKGKESIFQSPSQRVDHIDPKTIKLLGDRILVEEIDQEDGRVGSLVIPETCRNKSKIRRGVVVAVGPGDNCVERVDGKAIDADGRPMLRRKWVACDTCRGTGNHITEDGELVDALNCQACGGRGTGRILPQVKPGDKVLFDRRREAEIRIQGRDYSLVFEEQSIFVILDSAPKREILTTATGIRYFTVPCGQGRISFVLPHQTIPGNASANFLGEHEPLPLEAFDPVSCREAYLHGDHYEWERSI